MGSAPGPACELLCALPLMPDPRRMGDSAVVRRRLRSEELPEDGVSVRGGGREGRANGEADDGESIFEAAVEVWVGCGRIRAGSSPASLRKSTHVSPP